MLGLDKSSNINKRGVRLIGGLGGKAAIQLFLDIFGQFLRKISKSVSKTNKWGVGMKMGRSVSAN